MKENPVYRNIQFDPRIWGISYKSLFACLGILLVGIIFFKSIVGLAGGLVAGIGSALGFYAYKFWDDNRDKIETTGKKTPIRSMITSYTTGTQSIRLKGLKR